MAGFKYGEIFGEVTRNVRSNLRNAIALATVSVVTSALILMMSSIELAEADRAWEGHLAVGVFAFSVAERTGTYKIDVDRCDQLRATEGVVSAGGILASGDVYPVNQPHSRYRLLQASPGYARMAHPNLARVAHASVLAGKSAASDLGLTSGSEFSFLRDAAGPETVEVDLVASRPSRFAPLDRAVIVSVAARGGTSECVVEAEPATEKAVLALLQDWFAPTQVNVVPLHQPSDLEVVPRDKLQSRVGQLAPFAGGAFIYLAHLLSWRIRRQDYGVYRIYGLRLPGLTWMLAVESLFTAWLPVGIGSVLALASTMPVESSIVAASLLRDYGVTMLLVAPLPLLGAFMLSRTTALRVSQGR